MENTTTIQAYKIMVFTKLSWLITPSSIDVSGVGNVNGVQSYYFLFEEYTFRDLERLFFEVVQIQIGYSIVSFQVYMILIRSFY